MGWNREIASVALVVLVVACIILYIVVSYNSDNSPGESIPDAKSESNTNKE